MKLRLDWDGQERRYIRIQHVPPGEQALQDFWQFALPIITTFGLSCHNSHRLTPPGKQQIFPSGRTSRPVGPGIEIRDDPGGNRHSNGDLEDLTALE